MTTTPPVPPPNVVYVEAAKRKRWPYVLLGVGIVVALLAVIILAAVGGFNFKSPGGSVTPTPSSVTAPTTSQQPTAP